MTIQQARDKARQITNATNAIPIYGKNSDANHRTVVVAFETFLKEYCIAFDINYDQSYYSIVNKAYSNLGRNNNKDTNSIITSNLYFIVNKAD